MASNSNVLLADAVEERTRNYHADSTDEGLFQRRGILFSCAGINQQHERTDDVLDNVLEENGHEEVIEKSRVM